MCMRPRATGVYPSRRTGEHILQHRIGIYVACAGGRYAGVGEICLHCDETDAKAKLGGTDQQYYMARGGHHVDRRGDVGNICT